MPDPTTIPDWMPALFAELNRTYFEGALPPLHFGVNKMGGRLATYASLGAKGGMVWFHSGVLRQGRAYVADSLLHELVHHALQQRNGDPDQDHGPKFVEMANVIGARLGLPPVHPRSDEAIEWPQAVRPKGFHKWVLGDS